MNVIETDQVLPDGSILLCVRPSEPGAGALAEALSRSIAGEPAGKVECSIEANRLPDEDAPGLPSDEISLSQIDEELDATDEAEDERLSGEVRGYFDAVVQDVNGQIDESTVQEAVDLAWDRVVREYNEVLADQGNPYRISIDAAGDLEVCHADDLPDEYKPLTQQDG